MGFFLCVWGLNRILILLNHIWSFDHLHSRTAWQYINSSIAGSEDCLQAGCSYSYTVAGGCIKTTEVFVSWSKLAQPWIRSHILDYIPTEKGLETECENLNFSYQPRGEKATCSQDEFLMTEILMGQQGSRVLPAAAQKARFVPLLRCQTTCHPRIPAAGTLLCAVQSTELRYIFKTCC